MLDAVGNIADYVASIDETRFRAEKQIVHAVVWNLLGEAARACQMKV